MTEGGGPSLELTPRLRSLLLRSELPSPTDLKRLASYLHRDYLRQVNDPEVVLSILTEAREMLLDIAETLECHDSFSGGKKDARPKA